MKIELDGRFKITVQGYPDGWTCIVRDGDKEKVSEGWRSQLDALTWAIAWCNGRLEK